MTLKTIIIFNLGLLLASLACSCGLTPPMPSESRVTNSFGNSNGPVCEPNPFHFVIVRNDVQSENMRRIEIFMEATAYSVDNLKILFTRISDKYPEPKYLTIIVYTDWSQLDLPSDCPGTGIGGGQPRERPHELEFHHARYARRGPNIYFYYSVDLGTEMLETYVIQGKALGSPVW